MKKVLWLGVKVFLLTIVMFIGLAVSSMVAGVQHSSQPSGDSAVPVLIYAFLNTLVLVAFIVNSRFKGFTLIGTTAFLFWGIQYFMTQIETLYFNYAVQMPFNEIIKVVTAGAVNAVLFSSIAVPLMGKFGGRLVSFETPGRLKTSIPGLLSGIPLLSLAYVIIYYIFGYFVAWQFSAVRVFYSGTTDILNLIPHLANQIQTDPILPLFQLFRGFLWSGLAMILLCSVHTKSWGTYILSALLFSIIITTPLLFPNPYMPDAVRLGHSFELSTSMVLFGILSVLLLGKKSFDTYEIKADYL